MALYHRSCRRQDGARIWVLVSLMLALAACQEGRAPADAPVGGDPNVTWADPRGITLEKVTAGAPLVALGTVEAVLGSEVHTPPPPSQILAVTTDYQVDVARWLRGCGAPSIKIRLPGGRVGTVVQRAAIELTVGQELLLLLSWPYTGWTGPWGTVPEGVYTLTAPSIMRVRSEMAVGHFAAPFTVPLPGAIATIQAAPSPTPGLPSKSSRLRPTPRPTPVPTPGPLPWPDFCPEATPPSTPTPAAAFPAPAPGAASPTPTPAAAPPTPPSASPVATAVP